MIITALVEFIQLLLDFFLFFEIPPLSNEILGYFNDFLSYVESGASLLVNYVPLQYMLTLFSAIIYIDICVAIYEFVMWVIKKIPMAGMS